MVETNKEIVPEICEGCEYQIGELDRPRFSDEGLFCWLSVFSSEVNLVIKGTENSQVVGLCIYRKLKLKEVNINLMVRGVV